MNRKARLSIEANPQPEQAARAAASLDVAIKEPERKLLDLKTRMPELVAARARIGTPMPVECEGSEREFVAGLESIRAKIKTLRDRATQ